MARQIDLKSLYGGQIASADVVRKRMVGLEQELSRRQNGQESQRAAALWLKLVEARAEGQYLPKGGE